MELEIIEKKVYTLRGCKVMLDSDLAELYGVETKTLKQAVKRNADRFPEDFMFELTLKEFTNLRSQIVTSNWGGTRYLPYAFTEQGVAMLSSVLKSKTALQVNITIMRAFVTMRQFYLGSEELKRRIDALESEMETKFKDIHEALTYLFDPPAQERQAIGFRQGEQD